MTERKKSNVLLLGHPRAARWFNNLLPNLRTWIAAWELQNGWLRPRYEFELEDFDYSTRIADEGQQIFAFGSVRNVGRRSGSVYVRIVIYNPHHNSPPRELWTALIAISSRQVAFDSQSDARIDCLCETEIPQGESRGFAYTFAVPRLPADFADDSLTFYTRIELWKPPRRFIRSKRPLTIYQYQSSTHTRLQVVRPTHDSLVDMAQKMTTPSVAISYAWEGEDPRIAEMASILRRNGCLVWLDRSSQVGDTDAAIEEAINDCDIVLVVLTRKYLEKWDAFAGGVGKERHHITAKMRVAENCVLVMREPQVELPTELGHCFVEDATRTAWRGRPFGSILNQIMSLSRRTSGKEPPT